MQSKFGDRNLIYQQHQLSAKLAREEMGEPTRYTFKIRYSQSVTGSTCVSVDALNDDEAEALAIDKFYDMVNSREIDIINDPDAWWEDEELESIDLEEEHPICRKDDKTLDMFNEPKDNQNSENK